MVKTTIEIDVFEMINGNITKFYFNDNLFVIDNGIDTENLKPVKILARYKYKRSRNILDKYIQKNNLQTFNIKKFFHDEPRHRYEKGRVEHYISHMCADGTLLQLSNNEFKVIKKT